MIPGSWHARQIAIRNQSDNDQFHPRSITHKSRGSGRSQCCCCVDFLLQTSGASCFCPKLLHLPPEEPRRRGGICRREMIANYNLLSSHFFCPPDDQLDSPLPWRYFSAEFHRYQTAALSPYLRAYRSVLVIGLLVATRFRFK